MDIPISDGYESNAPSFEATIQAALEAAEQLPGHFKIVGDAAVAEIAYYESDPPECKASSSIKACFITDVRRLDPSQPPYNAYESARIHQSQLIETARHHLATRQKAHTLVDMLRRPDLLPSDIITITNHALRLLPELVAAQNIHDHYYYADIAQAILRRTLDLEADSAQQAFGLIATSCRQCRANLDESGATILDRFTNNIISSLIRRMSEARADVIDSQPRPGKWRYDSQGENTEQNALHAIIAFEEAGLVHRKIWQRLLGVPLTSQSLAITELLAEKLFSESAENIVGGTPILQRTQWIENVALAALERATAHQARDQQKLAIIRQAISGKAARPGAISLVKLARLAGKVIEQNYKDHLSSLTPENAFADSAQALSLLLQVALRPDAAPEDIVQANREAALYVRLATGIIEHPKTKQEPTIRTTGDLALRFVDATPAELEALKRSLEEGGRGPMDALRNQQLRLQGRSKLKQSGHEQIN